MLVNQATTQGNPALGAEVLGNEPTGEELRAAMTTMRTHDMRQWCGVQPWPGEMRAAVPALPRSVPGGWLGRVIQALQWRVAQTQERSVQRHAALWPSADFAAHALQGPFWLRGLGTLSLRLHATLATLKARLDPDAAALAPIRAAVLQRFAAQAADKQG